MRCPNCHDPMPQTRYEPGKFKVFECSRCRRNVKKTLARSEGSYSGQVVINSRIPITHQERE